MAFEFVARNGVIAQNDSTVSGSLNVTNGITGSLLGTASFAISASWAPGGGASGGSTSYIARWASATTLTTGSIYDTGTNVGIGTTNPLAKLVISNAGSQSIEFGYSSGLTSSYFESIDRSAGGVPVDFSYYLGGLSSHRFFTNATECVRITSTGNVGIGTLVPTSKLQVSGSSNIVNFRGSGSAAISSIFTVDGAAGRLFSVNDSLSGSLFSVNTIAGLPVIEAFSDNTVRIGQYGQRALFVSQSRVGINKETLLNANLDVSGSAVITGSLAVSTTLRQIGNMTVGADATTWTLAGPGNGGAIFQRTNTAAGGFDDRYLRLGSIDNSSVPYYVLTIFGASVGILTTSPTSASLQVNGNIFATSITGSLLGTGQLRLNNYTSTAAFPGTAVGYLGFDASGNILSSVAPAGGSTAIVFNRQTASYTLALTDVGDFVEMNSGSVNIVTVPSSSVVNFTTGSQITVVQYGAGQTHFTTGSTNVVIRSANNWLKINARYGAATLTKVGNDEWYLIGNLNA